MGTEIEEQDHYVEMNSVITRWIKGEKNPYVIAREMGIPRKEVLAYIEEWKRIAVNNPDVREVATASVSALNEHYDLLVKDLWDNARKQDDDGDYKGRATTLKMIGDLEAKRVETLQKAGLYDDAGLADQMVEMEQQMKRLKDLLVQVAGRHPIIKADIQEGLMAIFGQAPAVPYTNQASQDITVVRGEVST